MDASIATSVKVVKLRHRDINLFNIRVYVLRLNLPVLFIQLLEKNLEKKNIYIRMKEVMYIVFWMWQMEK